MASKTEAEVAGASVCWKFGPMVPYIRGTFKMRQDVHGEAFTTGTSAQILLVDIISSRALVFPFEGHSAKPVFVGRKLLMRYLSGSSLDLIYASRAKGSSRIIFC